MLPENRIPPPSRLSSSLANLVGLGSDGASPASGSDAGSRRIVVDSASDVGAAGDAGAAGSAQGAREKGAEDAAVSEKTASDAAALAMGEALRIPADLKTEAGSHYGDTEEDPGLGLPGDLDTVTLPVHSQLRLGGEGSVTERRRELARLMAEHLVQAALLAGSRNNITVMVALLPGCGI